MPNGAEIIELEKKRRALYACAMRYSTELLPLRDRVIDSVVLCALLGSNEKKPLKIGEIQSLISFGSNAPALRPEIIKESLSRLVKKDKVGEIEVRTKQAYFIREEAAEALNSGAQTSEELLTRVIKRHTQNFDGPKEQAFVVCQTFLSECFARLGSQIAQSVVKGIPFNDVVIPSEINDIFEKATSDKSLSKEAKRKDVDTHNFLSFLKAQNGISRRARRNLYSKLEIAEYSSSLIIRHFYRRSVCGAFGG